MSVVVYVAEMLVNVKFHYAILVADRSETAGRRPASELDDRPNSSSLQVCDELRTCLRPGSSNGILLLHFAWIVDDAKCIVVTRVCVSVCLSAAVCLHYFTDPDVTWGSGRGCP